MEVVLSQSGLITIGVSITSAGSEGRPDRLNSIFRTSDLNWIFLGERIDKSNRNGCILSLGSDPPSVRLNTVGCLVEEVEEEVRYLRYTRMPLCGLRSCWVG